MTRTPAPVPTILIVDDEPDILLILRILLRDLTSGYTISTAYSGDDALAYLNRQPVALVITDYNMPGMDGVALTAAIKARSPGTYVIMISAYPASNIEERAYEQGADLFLSKPFSVDRLIEAIKAGLQR